MQGSNLVTINKNGIILSVDEGFCKTFGYSFEEMVGNSINLIIPPPWKEQHDTYIMNYLNTGNEKILGKNRIVEGQHKNKSVFPIRIAVSAVNENEETVFVGVIEKIDDISASITISANGIVVACNQNTEELLGYKPPELIGQSADVIIPNPLKDQNDNFIKRFTESVGHTRTVMAKSKDGCSFPISLKIEEVRVGDIRLFRAKLEKVDHMEAVFTLSENGTILACNENFVMALFGFTKDDLVGHHLSSLIPNICGSYVEKTFVVDRSGSTSFNSNSQSQQSQQSDGEPSAKRQKTNRQLESWKATGLHDYNVVHKDGTSCPVIFEIYPLLQQQPITSSTSSTIETPSASPIVHNGSNNSTGSDYAIPVTSSGKKVETAGLVPKFCVKMKRAEFQHGGNHQHCHDSHKETVGNYILSDTVGQGTYGKVKLAHHKDTKQKVAVKILVKANMKPHEVERIHREIEIMRALDHPNICKLMDVIETEEAINLVMEFAGRTLTAITEAGKPLNDSEARRVFGQIASAVKFCHDLKVIHRDLKHQNILLDDKDNCKLIDFGLSNFMEEGKMRSTFCGTPAFAAPEMILGKKYSGHEVDIWSLGVILYSIISGTFPFDNVADIIRGTYKPPQGASAECFDLIKNMLQPNIETRYTVEQILAHKWLKDPSPFREMSSATLAAATPPMTTSQEVAAPETNGQSSSTQPAVVDDPAANQVKEIECKVVESKETDSSAPPQS